MELEKLKHLDADGRGIRDLTGLEKATGLKNLELRRNQLSSITPLKDLTQLTHLYLGDNQISDIKPLGLTKVEARLVAWKSSNESDYCRNDIKTLWLYENQIDNDHTTHRFTHISVLKLRQNQIDNSHHSPELTQLA